MEHFKPAISSTKNEILKRASFIQAQMHEYAVEAQHDEIDTSYEASCIEFLLLKIAEMEFWRGNELANRDLMGNNNYPY